MTPILSTLKKSGRAAVIALTLGAASLTAMPVQAQSFNFQLGIDSGGNALSFGIDAPRKKGFQIKKCLTNGQVRQGLRDFGFRNIDIIRNLNNNRVLVEATYNRKLYEMKVNKCNGRVYDVRRIRNNFNGGGFGLQFNFGNDY